ncbi:MAG: aminotransferase class V-fold PLP-dependent enzyme [Proteobacteria bacterium]|nr:aminotransferase class V-fold PLP-dependent enzyme [Burkholderiales bacterium]
MNAPAPRLNPDWTALRREFPTLERWTYLDAARKTPLARCAERAMHEFTRDIYEDAGAQAWNSANVGATRALMGELLGAKSDTIAFTRNTAEGLAIAAHAFDLRAGDNIVLTDMEHVVNLWVWQHWENKGVEIRKVANRGGRMPIEAYLERIDRRTRLVSTAYVTYANGWRIDIDALAEECRTRDIRLVLDAVQGAGLLARRIDSLGADFIAIGAHKSLQGLTGTGVVWCREALIAQARTEFVRAPGIVRGADIGQFDYVVEQHRFEAGNPNFLGLWVLRRSAEFLLSIGLPAIEQRVRELTESLLERVARAGIETQTSRDWAQRCHIVNMLVPDAAGLQQRLRERGIVVNVKDDKLRASVSFYNDERDLDVLMTALAELRAAHH